MDDADGPVRIFDEHAEVLAAIRRVQRFLDSAYIVEECGDGPPVMGCASCQAIAIRRDLEMLATEVDNDSAA